MSRKSLEHSCWYQSPLRGRATTLRLLGQLLTVTLELATNAGRLLNHTTTLAAGSFFKSVLLNMNTSG